MSDYSVGQWIPQVTHTFHWNTQEMEPTQSGLYAILGDKERGIASTNPTQPNPTSQREANLWETVEL